MAGAYIQSSYYFAPRLHWENAVCDARYDEIIASDTTDARRKDALIEAINACNDDAIYIWTYWSPNIAVSRDSVIFDWENDWNAMYPGSVPPYKLLDVE
jgi:hypothetical protein